MNRLAEFFQGPSGQYSSKRLFAFACFAVAVVLVFRGADNATIGVFLAPAVAALITQAATGT